MQQAGPSSIQVIPKPVASNGNKENCGGYDCEFVEPPPDLVQMECPICLMILKSHVLSTASVEKRSA